MTDLIIEREQLAASAAGWKASNRRVVLTNGCFDLLHVGHLHTFTEAKKLGDLLVVGVNSDRSVAALKGPARPVNSESDRACLVAALKPVDFVTIFDENDASQLLKIIQPRFYVKGGDYSLENLPEKNTLARLQTEVVFIPLLAGFSTTGLLSKIAGIDV